MWEPVLKTQSAGKYFEKRKKTTAYSQPKNYQNGNLSWVGTQFFSLPGRRGSHPCPPISYTIGCNQGHKQLFISGGGNFHEIEISIDDVIVLIQPWYNFFANGHR